MRATRTCKPPLGYERRLESEAIKQEKIQSTCFRKLAYLLVIALIGSMTSELPAKAAPETRGETQLPAHLYEVMSLSGTVITRSPHSPRWYSVGLGMRLHPGQLIQVTEGSRLGLKTAKETISLPGPIIVRLGPDMLRDIQLNQHIITELTDLSSSLEEASSGKLRWYLDEAWNRAAAIFPSANKNIDLVYDAATIKEMGVLLGVTGDDIRVFSPISDAVIETKRFPVEIRLAWSPNEAVNGYKVFLWRLRDQDLSKLRPIAVTRHDFHTITVDKPGSYVLQITSLDRSSQSMPQLVHVLDANMSPQLGRDNQRPVVTLHYPPQDYYFVTKSPQVQVKFMWHQDEDIELVEHRLILFDSNDQQQAYMVRSDQLPFRLNLSNGEYYWQVESWIYQEARHHNVRGSRHVASEKRRLLVISGSEDQANILSRFLNDAKPGAVVYLDFGL